MWATVFTVPHDAGSVEGRRIQLGLDNHGASTRTSVQWDNVKVWDITGLPDGPQPGEAALPEGMRRVDPCGWAGHGRGLCVYPMEGGDPFRILQETELEIVGGAAWSPDGERIVFSAREPVDAEDPFGLYTVNADGSGLQALPSDGNDFDPVWSPDGEAIALQSSCGLAILHLERSGLDLIYPPAECRCVDAPQWSPDGQRIVFSLSPSPDCPFPAVREVLAISRDGTATISVAAIDHPDLDSVHPEVAFHPDGEQVAYLDAAYRTWIMRADGEGEPVPFDGNLYEWVGSTYPQWGAR
jgi:dipeptidyl aminopeptidase/acylaminoacyl peptidase